MMPEDVAKVIPLCDRCDRARNPASSLAWFATSDGGLLCGNCYTPPPEPDTTSIPFAVVVCPQCRGSGCARCAKLGVVRVPTNAIPVWSGEPAKPLTEDS